MCGIRTLREKVEKVMNSTTKNFKMAVSALGLGAGLLLGTGGSANAQGQYDPYYGQGTYSGRDYGRHQKNEKRAEKRHQKNEKEDLKAHQRNERDQYGNDADLRAHQRQEREELKRHEQAEKNARKSHQRNERNGGYNRNDGYYGNDGYNRNDGYYGNDGYGSNVNQAAFDRGYQEGVRAGQNDRYNNRRYDYQNHSTYRDATAGYNSRYGDRNSYRNSFRGGFQRGYDEGYNSSNNSGRSRNGIGGILGSILGIP